MEARSERESYLDNLIDEFEARDHYRSLSVDWLSFLEVHYFPSRFAGHALQMSTAYVAQMAPSSYVANPFHFQTGDEMRRVQRTAYLAKALSIDNERPGLADSARARKAWERNKFWQPLRELLEKQLIVYDWGEAFATRSLIVKPLYDNLFNVELARLARANGDELLALLHDDFQNYDSRYSIEVSQALTRFVTEGGPEVRKILQSWLEKWAPLTYRAVVAIAGGFSEAPNGLDSAAAAQRAIQNWGSLLESCGLSAVQV